MNVLQLMSLRGRALSTICATVAGLAAPALGVNIITDPGFETNALTTGANSLGNFPGFQGVWGHESSSIVPTTGPITPFQGNLQLEMIANGGVTTQAFQSIDITSYAALVDSNNAQINVSAYFNADLISPLAGVYVSYFTGNTYGTVFGPLDTNQIILDSNPNTWEQASLTVPVPATTRWILIQVAYAEATMIGSNGAIGPGYVDGTFAEIIAVPAPASAALLGAGAIAGTRRRRTTR